MTYLPPNAPYAPYPHPAYTPTAALRAPARRASVLMMVVGSLTLIFGVLLGLMALFWGQFASEPELAEQVRQLESQLQGVSVQLMLGVFSGLLGVVGLAMLALGILARKGTPARVIPGLVLTGLVLLFWLANTFAVVRGGSPAQVVFAGLILLTLVLQIVWLIQATRNAPAVARTLANGLAQWQPQPNYPANPYANPALNPALNPAPYYPTPPQPAPAPYPPPPPEESRYPTRP